MACRGWSWFDSTMVGQRSSPNIFSRSQIASPYASADHGAVEQLPVEHEVAVGREDDGALGFAGEQLADRHPARLLIDDGPEPADQVREVGLVAVVQVLLACPQRGALDLAGWTAARGA